MNKIEELITGFIENQSNEAFAVLIEQLIDTDVILVNNDNVGEGLKKLNDGAITPLVITDRDGKNYIPLFTSDDQIIADKIKKLERVPYIFKDLCNDSVEQNEYIEGYVINPFTQGLKIPKEVIRIVINYTNENIQ